MGLVLRRGCPNRVPPVAQMSHASVIIWLLNIFICKRIVIHTFTGESVDNCGSSVCRSVDVLGSGVSGVADSCNA